VKSQLNQDSQRDHQIHLGKKAVIVGAFPIQPQAAMGELFLLEDTWITEGD